MTPAQIKPTGYIRDLISFDVKNKEDEELLICARGTVRHLLSGMEFEDLKKDKRLTETHMDFCERHGLVVFSENRTRAKLTELGKKLAHSSFGRIHRTYAEKQLLKIIANATAYNANPAARKIITSITVFGSYLTSALEYIGDLDLVIEDKVRPKTEQYAENSAQIWSLKDIRKEQRADKRLFMPRWPRHVQAWSPLEISYLKEIDHKVVYAYSEEAT